LGLAYDGLDRLPEAVAMYRKALAIYEKKTPVQQSLISIVSANLVSVLVDLGQFEEALPLAHRAVEIVGRNYGPNHPYLARALHNLGTVCQAQKKPEEAQAHYERARAIWDKNPGGGTLDRASV